MNFVFSGNKITAPSPQVLRCPYVYGCALGLEYGPTWKTCTHDANEEERKDIGRGGRVSFTSNFGRTFFCRRQCCDMLHWNVAVVCRSFKPITRRSLSVLSITFVIVVVSVPVQGIFFMKKHTSWLGFLLFWGGKTQQDQSSAKFCSGDRVCWRLRASVTPCCDFYLRVFSLQWVFGRFLYNGFKYSRIFTTVTFTFRFCSRQNPPCYVITVALCRWRKVAVLNKMSSNATPLQTFCQTDSLVKFIFLRNLD